MNCNDKMQSVHFGWVDYTIFVLMLVVCTLIGVYFGYKIKRKEKTKITSVEADYYIGGRNMNIFPVSMSLVSSWISGISLLGIPSEMYVHGTEYMFIIGAILLSGLCSHYIFLPVYMNMKITSVYEYLEIRFDRRMRLFGSILFILASVFYVAIVIYVPALGLNQMTGIDVHLITTVTCFVCIFYTSVGGIKAVVWTDFIQTIIMCGTMIAIVIKGTYDNGGIATIYQRNMESGRIIMPPFDIDPTIRHSMFSVVLGGGLFWAQANCVNQAMLQRYLALPDIKSARKALWVFSAMIAGLMVICCYNGLLMYAKYYDCDPLTTRRAQETDQLLPVFVMDIFYHVPGFGGLFISGIFSAGLSSLSTELNSLSAIVLEDFIKPNSKQLLTDFQTNIIMRGFVIIFGIVCIALVFVIQKMGAVLQLSVSLDCISNGPLFAIFLVGLFLPWINGKSVFVGGLSGLVIMTWVIYKHQDVIQSGHEIHVPKPVSVDGCPGNYSVAYQEVSKLATKSIYHISYLWLTMLGTIVTIVISCLASLVFGCNDIGKIRPGVLAPFIRKYVQSENVNKFNKVQYEMQTIIE